MHKGKKQREGKKQRKLERQKAKKKSKPTQIQSILNKNMKKLAIATVTLWASQAFPVLVNGVFRNS